MQLSEHRTTGLFRSLFSHGIFADLPSDEPCPSLLQQHTRPNACKTLLLHLPSLCWVKAPLRHRHRTASVSFTLSSLPAVPTKG